MSWWEQWFDGPRSKDGGKEAVNKSKKPGKPGKLICRYKVNRLWVAGWIRRRSVSSILLLGQHLRRGTEPRAVRLRRLLTG